MLDRFLAGVDRALAYKLMLAHVVIIAISISLIAAVVIIYIGFTRSIYIVIAGDLLVNIVIYLIFIL